MKKSVTPVLSQREKRNALNIDLRTQSLNTCLRSNGSMAVGKNRGNAMDANMAGVADVPCKDRKTGLIVFGVLQLILGGFCLLFLLFMCLGALLPQPAGAETSARMLAPALLVYVALAIWFIVMGIASIRARRWARALILTASWFWLICGVMGLIFMVGFRPIIMAQMNRGGQIPEAVASAILITIFVFMFVIYLLLPGGFVLFYGSRHVKATCERLDPVARWTDQCPLPVLAASLMCGLWAAGLLSMGLYGWPMPVFGRMVSGAAGAAISLGMLLLLGYAAWGIVRLQRLAWWCAVVAVLVWGVSWFLLLMGPGLMPFYETMGMGEQQLAGIRQMVVALGPQMAWLSGCWLVALLGYLFYIRRFFPKPETA